MSKQWGHGYYTGYEQGQADIHAKLATVYHYPLYDRWSKFFDSLHWEYLYKPFRINDWTPIFTLSGAHLPILVDVRYSTLMDEFAKIADDEIYPNIKDTLYEECEILFLTSAIFPESHSFSDFPVIGWLEDNNCGIDEALLNYYDSNYGFFHATGSWKDRITGLYDGDHLLSPPVKRDVLRLWNIAAIDMR